MAIPKSEYGYMSIDQYCPPLCFELAGQELELVMDDGYDQTLRFVDGQQLEWGPLGGELQTESYKCLKADDETYLVNFERAGVTPRECYTYVLDKENMLVTRLIAKVGENPRYPYLINTHFEFGAIRKADGSLTFQRHGYTSDVIGTCVQWTYGCELATVHVYYCANFYRITYPADRVVSEESKAQNAEFNDVVASLPSSDEPAVYVKIKDRMYLTSIIEQNMEKLTAGKLSGFRSNTLCFLQNYSRMYQVGRGFGTTSTPEGDQPINIMIGAYGKPAEVDPGFFNDPNPSLV